MADVCQITLTGRITNEPDMRYTKNGTPVLNFSMACNRWKGGDTKTSFYDCQIWGKLAETKIKVMSKGGHICVSGSLDIEEYEGRNGKTKKAVITVIALEPSPGERTEKSFTGGPEDFVDYPIGDGFPSSSSKSYTRDMSFDDDLDIPF